MEGRLLLDVVVREGAAVLELLAGKDEALLVGRDALLVLDLGLDVVDRVRRLDLKGDLWDEAPSAPAPGSPAPGANRPAKQ